MYGAATKVSSSVLFSEVATWLTNPTVVSRYDLGIKTFLIPEVIPDKLQGTLLKIMKLARDENALGPILAAKAIITLTPPVASTILMNIDWYDALLVVCKTCKVLLRVCRF